MLWKARGEREKGFTSPPVDADGKLFIGSRVYRETEGQRLPAYALLAFSANVGSELWRFATEKHIFVPPAAAGDTLRLSVDDGAFYALDAASGAEHWAARVAGRVVAQPHSMMAMVVTPARATAVTPSRWRAGPAEQSCRRTHPGAARRAGGYGVCAPGQRPAAAITRSSSIARAGRAAVRARRA
jgi:hypothetical protein